MAPEDVLEPHPELQESAQGVLTAPQFGDLPLSDAHKIHAGQGGSPAGRRESQQPLTLPVTPPARWLRPAVRPMQDEAKGHPICFADQVQNGDRGIGKGAGQHMVPYGHSATAVDAQKLSPW